MSEHDHPHHHHSHAGIDRRGLLAAGAGGLLVLATPGVAHAQSRTTRAETGTAATVGAGPAVLTGAARASAITAGTARRARHRLGFPEGKGRTGLWVTQNTRAGVLEAMRARRFFATRVSGLRVDATADDVRMGGVLPIARGDVRFALDLDRGPDWSGKPVRIQVLRPGVLAPTVADVIDTVANQVVRFTVPLDVAMGNWVVLRVSDPTRPNPSPGPNGHPCNDFGLAYTSPWWLQP